MVSSLLCMYRRGHGELVHRAELGLAWYDVVASVAGISIRLMI